MADQPCAVGFVAKTGQAAIVAHAARPGTRSRSGTSRSCREPGQGAVRLPRAAQLTATGPARCASNARPRSSPNETSAAITAGRLEDLAARGRGGHSRRRSWHTSSSSAPLDKILARGTRSCTPPKVPLPRPRSWMRSRTAGSLRRSYRGSSSDDRERLDPFGKVPPPWRRSTKTPPSPRSRSAEQMVAVPSRELGAQRVHVRRGERAVPARVRGRHHTASSVSQCSRRSTRFSTFWVAVDGSPCETRTNRGSHLGDRSDLRVEERRELVRRRTSRRRAGAARPSPGRRRRRRAPRSTAASTTSGWRAIMCSTGAAAKFSPSTRSQSESRPAK